MRVMMTPDLKRRRTFFSKEQRVTSAITISELESYLNGICAEPLNSWFKSSGITSLDGTYNYQQHFFEGCVIGFSSSKSLPANIIRSLETTVHISHYAWSRTQHKPDLSCLNMSPVFIKYWNLRLEYDKIIRFFRNRVTEVIGETSFPRLGLKISSCGDYYLMEFQSRRTIIIPWMSMIAIQDSLIGMVDVLCYSIISDRELNTTYYSQVTSFIDAGIQSVIQLGSNVYKALKALHPLSVGMILEHEMSGYTNTLKDEVLNEMPVCPLREYWTSNGVTLERSLSLLKLSGLSKLFTYPVVDINGAVKNVISKGSEWRPKTAAHSHKAANMLKKIFCREYLRQHHVWPPVIVTGDIPGSVQESLNNNTWSETHGEWHPEVFQNIKIEHCINMNLFPDSTELLKDKAICVGIKSWPREYDIRYHRLKYGRGCNPGPVEPKRGIIKHLLSEEVDTLAELKKFINIVRKGTNMIIMCIKEKELNQEKARYFTKLTWEHRFAQALSEEACRSVMKYFPHQSMTMSGITLEKFKLRTSNKVAMTISLDFSKWCLNQRGEINEPDCQSDRWYNWNAWVD